MSDQEPFGWLYESKAGVRIFHFVSDNEPLVQADWEAAQQYPEAHKMTPLYAHPPQRKPLTGVDIYALFQKVGLEAYHQRDSVLQYDYDKRIEEFARAIERAHGIGGEE